MSKYVLENNNYIVITNDKEAAYEIESCTAINWYNFNLDDRFYLKDDNELVVIYVDHELKVIILKIESC